MKDQREYNRTYYKAHRTDRKASDRAYYKTHLTQISIRQKAYRKTHRTQISVRQKAYLQAHRAQENARNRAYDKAHPEIRAGQREREITKNAKSRETATQHREFWGPVEDVAVMNSKPAVLLAAELGRTIAAIYERRYRLRKESP